MGLMAKGIDHRAIWSHSADRADRKLSREKMIKQKPLLRCRAVSGLSLDKAVDSRWPEHRRWRQRRGYRGHWSRGTPWLRGGPLRAEPGRRRWRGRDGARVYWRCC